MNKIDMIKQMLKENDGKVTTKMLAEKGIHRQYLKNLADEGKIECIARGVYVNAGKSFTDYYALSEQFKNGIFSHNAALYIYGMTDRTPLTLDMTFPSNIRISSLASYLVNIHYINKERFELGLTTKKLWDGSTIRIYNLERTICDIIRDRNKIDSQIFNTALKEYMKRKDKNLNLLYEYAKKFKILKIVKMYLEVLG